MLKKTNAVIALITVILFVFHNAVNACLMLLGRAYQSPAIPARILTLLLGAHILLSLYALIFKNDGSKVKYRNFSKGWTLQRFSGLAVIPAVCLHAVFHDVYTPAFLISHILLTLFSLIHIPLSVPNALVTLGIIDSMKQHRTVRSTCWIVCALLFLLTVLSNFPGVIAR